MVYPAAPQQLNVNFGRLESVSGLLRVNVEQSWKRLRFLHLSHCDTKETPK